MTITAEIVEDSISWDDIRLTTFLLRYPRFIHAELMTHRVFSRNASSSRAIPVERMIADIRRDPAMPVFWGSNKPGMQAGDELSGRELIGVQVEWAEAMDLAIQSAEVMVASGLHKQIANRILEPWGHINVVVTATEWDNFWALRCHPDAQPEMQALAHQMKVKFDSSDPEALGPDEWHLPFIHEDEFGLNSLEDLRKASVARCARTSYMTHDLKAPNIEDDIKLHDKLVASVPIHASPAEHQATPDTHYKIRDVGGLDNSGRKVWNNPDEHGNFRGWRQYRKLVEKELARCA